MMWILLVADEDMKDVSATRGVAWLGDWEKAMP
jgi:predicted phage gp36 major capsid-like protein